MAGSNGTTKIDRAHGVWSILLMVLTVCAVIILFMMMLLTSVDVVARYVFNSPVRGAYELTEIGLATLVYLALPIATATGSHIAVELLPVPRSSVLAATIGLFVKSVTALVFALIAWQVWKHAVKLQSYEQVTNSLEIPLAIVAFVVAIGAGLSVISSFFQKLP